METGDTFTIAGVNRMVPNPSRKWWQFWKPRMIDSGQIQMFIVTEHDSSFVGCIDPEYKLQQREENQRLSRFMTTW